MLKDYIFILYQHCLHFNMDTDFISGMFFYYETLIGIVAVVLFYVAHRKKS